MTGRHATWAAMVLVGLAGCASRAFEVNEEEKAPLSAPTIEGTWEGEHTWANGMRHVRLVLHLEQGENGVMGTGELTGTVDGNLAASGTFRAPELHLTLLGDADDDRYLLPGRLSADGLRIEGYFRGAGVDFELTLRRNRRGGS